MFLRASLSLLWCRLALPFCPALFHRCRDALPCCCTHAATFLAATWFSLARLGWTTTPYRLGTEAHKSCNCTFDTASFLSEFCHYALNVHDVLSLIAISAQQLKALIVSLGYHQIGRASCRAR